jgi:predicted metal-dependent enzyme (double-stranded beta helix superfamily)
MRIAAAANDENSSIAQRLEAIQAELECEFHALRSDLARPSHPRYAELMVVAEKIDFARYCLSCAVRVANDRRVAILLEG